jgi:hypothetical protein
MYLFFTYDLTSLTQTRSSLDMDFKLTQEAQFNSFHGKTAGNIQASGIEGRRPRKVRLKAGDKDRKATLKAGNSHKPFLRD